MNIKTTEVMKTEFEKMRSQENYGRYVAHDTLNLQPFCLHTAPRFFTSL